MSKFNIGVIVDDVKVSKQVYDLLEMANKSTIYSVSHLIVQDIDEKPENNYKNIYRKIKKSGFFGFFSATSFKVLSSIEFFLIRLLYGEEFSAVNQIFDISSLNIEVIRVNPSVSQSGHVYRYSDSDLQKLRLLDLKMLIRKGSGILRGDILDLCEHGILSFHHGDNDVIRGGPAGFWEVYNQEKVTGFIIQSLTEELDGGDILLKASLPTRPFYALNYSYLHEKSTPFLHKTIEKVLTATAPIEVYPKRPYAHGLYRTPSLGVQIKYLFQTFVLFFQKLCRKVLSSQSSWGVAYQFTDDWRDVTLSRCVVINNPINHFLADPFVIQKGGIHYCFVEDFDLAIGRGSISVYKIGSDSIESLGTALTEDFHLSYPFLLEIGDELYMCPETHESRDIRLYRCIDFPLKWELERVLIEDIDAADTNIFFKNDKWWLMTNVCSGNLKDHDSELHIYMSENLFSGEWIPHHQNPVIFDSSHARNGGLIIDGDEHYRVQQNPDFDTYGRSFSISRIVTINSHTYSEESIFQVTPNFFPDIVRTHSYNYKSGLMVIDFFGDNRGK